MNQIALIALVLGSAATALNATETNAGAKVSLASCEGYYVGESSFDRRNVAETPERFLGDKMREPVGFVVLIENTSSRDIGIYRQWNSWGYRSIHFLVEGPDGKQTVIEKGPRAWTKNYPDSFRLPPGMTHAVPISFTSKEWKGVEVLSTKGAKLKAVFQQEPLDERLKLSIWSDTQIFTNKTESAFVIWETLTRRKTD